MDIDRSRAPSRARLSSIPGVIIYPVRRSELMARPEGGSSVVPGTGGKPAAHMDGADFSGITDDSDSGETS
jgi:hypothetical protein